MLREIETEVHRICEGHSRGAIPFDSVIHHYSVLHNCIADMFRCGLIVRETKRKYEGALQPLIEIILQGR